MRDKATAAESSSNMDVEPSIGDVAMVSTFGIEKTLALLKALIPYNCIVTLENVGRKTVFVFIYNVCIYTLYFTSTVTYLLWAVVMIRQPWCAHRG